MGRSKRSLARAVPVARMRKSARSAKCRFNMRRTIPLRPTIWNSACAANRRACAFLFLFYLLFPQRRDFVLRLGQQNPERDDVGLQRRDFLHGIGAIVIGLLF